MTKYPPSKSSLSLFKSLLLALLPFADDVLPVSLAWVNVL
jgi:hypothetical protein